MAKYWKQRAIDLEKLVQDKNDKTIIKINQMYELVFKELDKEIRKIFNTYANNADLTVADALKLLNAKQTKEAQATLKRIYDRVDDPDIKQDILNKLNAPSYAARIAKIEALRDLIFCEAQSIGWMCETALTPRLIDSFETSYYQSHYIIQKGTGLAYDFNKLSNPAVKSAIAADWKGSNYSKRIWKSTNKLAKEAEDVITRGLMTGISQAKMVTELQKKLDTGRYEVNRVVRTEVSYCAGQGRLMSYDEAEIEKYIFIATLDLRTSSICRKLDGTIHLRSEAQVGKNFPPMHPHCRSVDGAYIEGKDYSKLKRRARNPITGENELVPQNMSYKQWYKEYVEKSARARANEKAVKEGILKPYRYSDEELKEALKEKRAEKAKKKSK